MRFHILPLSLLVGELELVNLSHCQNGTRGDLPVRPVLQASTERRVVLTGVDPPEAAEELLVLVRLHGHSHLPAHPQGACRPLQGGVGEQQAHQRQNDAPQWGEHESPQPHAHHERQHHSKQPRDNLAQQ